MGQSQTQAAFRPSPIVGSPTRPSERRQRPTSCALPRASPGCRANMAGGPKASLARRTSKPALIDRQNPVLATGPVCRRRVAGAVSKKMLSPYGDRGFESVSHMKALFLGHFAATVAPLILAKVKTPLETSILDDEGNAALLAPLLADAEIVVGHIWRAGFPPAPRLRLLQSVAAGLDLLDTATVPKRHDLQRVRPRARDSRIRHHDNARPDPSPVRRCDGVPLRLVGREPPVWRRLSAWRGDGAHDRDHRLRTDRARGGGARRGA